MAKRGRPRRAQPVRISLIQDSGKGKENDVGIPKIDRSGEILGDPALEDPAAGLIEVPVVAQDGGCDSGKKTPLHGVIKEVDAWGLEQEQQKPYLRAVRRGIGADVTVQAHSQVAGNRDTRRGL
ncbi:hypothetical protein Dimus_034450 [Dionaea muscipula]